jgi:hypothetical protein
MKFTHHGLPIELPDDWWDEASMGDFVRNSNAYRVGHSNTEIFEVCIDDVGPVHRSPGVGIFNRSIEDGLTARERVVRVLRAFRLGDAIPPVQVLEGKPGDPHYYKLTHGVHRLYCSLAAGFTHVPAVKDPRIAE